MATVEIDPHVKTRSYRVRYRKPDGKSTTKRGFKTKKAAEDWAATCEADKLRGDYISPRDGQTLYKLVAERWERTLGGLKETAEASALNTLKVHVLPKWGSRKLVSIETDCCRAWVGEMAEDGIGAPTIEKAVSVHKRILDLAAELKYIPRNPAAGVKTPACDSRPRNYLTHQRVELLAAQPKRFADQVSLYLLAYTGARYGEMIATLPTDYNQGRRRMSITKGYAEVGGRMVLGQTKTYQTRTAPYPQFLAEMLEELLAAREKTDLVFTSPQGHVMRGTNFRHRVFYPAVKAAKLIDPKFPEITPHDLRHTAASLAVSAGANVKAIQRMLGHSRAAVTLDVYADLFDDDLDDVANRMGQARLESREKVIRKLTEAEPQLDKKSA